MKSVMRFVPALLCVSVLTMAGCSSKKTMEEPVVVEESEAIGVVEPLDSTPISFGVGEARTTDGMLPVYFGFDSSEIPGDQVSRIGVNADFMKKHGDVVVRIEGNCDPRGTKEYNMALGERRALTAKKYLVNMGIDQYRLETVSYGKERLLFRGHDELSWAQDRRDDFVVVGGTEGEVVQ